MKKYNLGQWFPEVNIKQGKINCKANKIEGK